MQASNVYTAPRDHNGNDFATIETESEELLVTLHCPDRNNSRISSMAETIGLAARIEKPRGRGGISLDRSFRGELATRPAMTVWHTSPV